MKLINLKLILTAISFLLLGCLICQAQSSIESYYDEENDLYGLQDTISLKVILHGKYAYIGNFLDGLAVVNDSGYWEYSDEDSWDMELYGGKWGLIDKTGKEIVAPKYDYISDFSNGVTKVRLNEKWGCINKLGLVIIPIEFESIDSYNNYYEVSIDSNIGLFSKNGTEILPPVYTAVTLSLNELTALVETKELKYGLMNVKTKKFIIEPQMDNAQPLNNDLFIANKSQQFALYNYSGKLLIPYGKYKFIESVQDTLLCVRNDTSAALCDINEHFIIPFGLYDNLFDYNCYLFEQVPGEDYFDYIWFDYLLVSRDKKWGCVDLKGNILIPADYNDIFAYSDTIEVSKGNKWMVIDKHNNTLIEQDTNIYKNCYLDTDYDLAQLVAYSTINGNDYMRTMNGKVVGDEIKYKDDIRQVVMSGRKIVPKK